MTKKKAQKAAIEEFIRKQNTKQNRIRELLRKGEYVEETFEAKQNH